MKPATKLSLKRRRGQGMTEYIIIVALIAIAAIAVITIFGDNIRHLFAGSADALGGAQNVSNTGTQNADTQNNTHKTLTTYGQNNVP